MASGVLILAEIADGAVAPVTAELVAAAKSLNAGPVSAMVIGSGVEGAAGGVLGVEKTYVVDDAALAQYTTDGYTKAAVAVAQQAQPSVVLLAQSDSIFALQSVASHPNAPPDLLSKLAAGPHASRLTSELLKNPSTPRADLLQLAASAPTDRRPLPAPR